MVTGQQAGYQSSFVTLAFLYAFDDWNADECIKIGDDKCTSDINLVCL